MIILPPKVSLSDFFDSGVYVQSHEHIIVWCTPSVADRLRALVPCEVVNEEPVLTSDTKWLLVVGGGTLIDRAKVLRAKNSSVKLAALPTVWGSGAEASSIAVINEDDKKNIHIGQEYLPDLIVTHPELAKSLPDEIKKQACGDALSHALEGFLSPLGNDETRKDLSEVLKAMFQQPLGYSEDWFDLSEKACVGQSKTSVGLVHGVAHVLEGVMGLGHARLCSLYLLPVMSFNKDNSVKWPLFAEYGLSNDAIFAVLCELFDEQAYAATLPSLKENWMSVLRDSCSRTNSAIVRPGDIGYFESFLS